MLAHDRHARHLIIIVSRGCRSGPDCFLPIPRWRWAASLASNGPCRHGHGRNRVSVGGHRSKASAELLSNLLQNTLKMAQHNNLISTQHKNLIFEQHKTLMG